MKVTYKWLQEYINFYEQVTPQAIIDKLNAIGMEVEGTIDYKKIYSPFIIAHIEEAQPHDNADSLQVCKVWDGKSYLQIICGAKNARPGINVVLAPLGTSIPNSGITIERRKIRGVESEGMLCSLEELSFGSGGGKAEILSQLMHARMKLEVNPEGIIELPLDIAVGGSLASLLGLDDMMFDIALTPNRRLDGASLYGIARDLAAAEVGEFIPLLTQEDSEEVEEFLAAIEAKECRELSLTLIENIKQPRVPTSERAQICDEEFYKISKYLGLVGQLHQLDLVNISNFAMLSFGRPNHIYDSDKIKGKVTARYSREGEEFIALGGAQYKLPKGLLVIADEQKILSIAGIMGGELSKVEAGTRNILVEIGEFEPEIISKGGAALNLRTEAMYRFEGRVDFGITDSFISYLINLIVKLRGGRRPV